MKNVMRKQMYTVGGYMLNKILIKIYVKSQYLWYYLQHPDMYWKRFKLRKNNMIDREHDEFNWKLVFNWILMMIVGGSWWYSVFFNGFLVTIIWTFVLGAVYGLWVTMQDMRG